MALEIEQQCSLLNLNKVSGLHSKNNVSTVSHPILGDQRTSIHSDSFAYKPLIGDFKQGILGD